MHPKTKVLLRGRPLKGPTVRYKKGVRQVLHYIFSVESKFWDSGCEIAFWFPLGASTSGKVAWGPVFVAEATDPIKWARTTRSQWKRRRIALWLRQRKLEGSLPIFSILEEVWVSEGRRRSSRLAWWVRKLRPTLQGTLREGDPEIDHPYEGR